MQTAEYQQTQKSYLNDGAKKYQQIKNAMADPWENERERIMGDFMQRKQQML